MPMTTLRSASPIYIRVATSLVLLSSASAVAQSLVCPPGMARVDDFCVDRWEAHLVGESPYEVPTGGIAASAGGVVPQGYISGAVASAACQNAGKRLCTDAEWLRACQGPTPTAFPYGDVYDPNACNDSRPEHPVITLYGSGATFSSEQTNDPLLNQLPDSLDAAGVNAQCVSAEGVFDLHGNLHEWTSDPSGTFRGGSYVEAFINGTGCSYRTTAHTTLYHDFSTGFRCCAEPAPVASSVPGTGVVGRALLLALLAALSLGMLARRVIAGRIAGR